MEIIINHGENMEIVLKGRLDTITSATLQEKFNNEQINENLVIINATDLEYISSAGLRVLLTLKKTLNAKQKAFEIHNLNAVCKEVFKVTGFDNILTVK